MLISIRFISWAAMSLLALAYGCSLNDQPQAAPKPSTTSVSTTATSKTPPPQSLVKRLLETNECPKCDLSGVELRDADLRGAELTDADLEGANLQGANLSKANVEEIDLEGANLRGG